MKNINWGIVGNIVIIILCLSSIVKSIYNDDYTYITYPIIIIGISLVSIAFKSADDQIK